VVVVVEDGVMLTLELGVVVVVVVLVGVTLTVVVEVGVGVGVTVVVEGDTTVVVVVVVVGVVEGVVVLIGVTDGVVDGVVDETELTYAELDTGDAVVVVGDDETVAELIDGLAELGGAEIATDELTAAGEELTEFAEADEATGTLLVAAALVATPDAATEAVVVAGAAVYPELTYDSLLADSYDFIMELD